MTISRRTATAFAGTALAGLAVFALTGNAGADSAASAADSMYRVTLVDITPGQPLSPPVAATHTSRTHLFQLGRSASDALAAVAQDGNPMPLATGLDAQAAVTDVVSVGHPLTPQGHTVGTFTDSTSFVIKAHRGDRFSLVSMLICTNDGFAGLDGVRLPSSSSSYLLRAYDAGREINTQHSQDLPDPCSAVGNVALHGDPNGNRDAEVASPPNTPITVHPGIVDSPCSDLTAAQHGWYGPVATVVITKLS